MTNRSGHTASGIPGVDPARHGRPRCARIMGEVVASATTRCQRKLTCRRRTRHDRFGACQPPDADRAAAPRSASHPRVRPSSRAGSADSRTTRPSPSRRSLRRRSSSSKDGQAGRRTASSSQSCWGSWLSSSLEDWCRRSSACGWPRPLSSAGPAASWGHSLSRSARSPRRIWRRRREAAAGKSWRRRRRSAGSPISIRSLRCPNTKPPW